MPIYEFYCDRCTILFKFFSRTVDTISKPDCPRCGKRELRRQMSIFTTQGQATEDSNDIKTEMDESRMEEAFSLLMKEADCMHGDDPGQMATLMRHFTEKSGLTLGDTMEEAISRMENGEDPNSVEKALGERLNGDDLFSFEGIKKSGGCDQKSTRRYDDKLYELKITGNE